MKKAIIASGLAVACLSGIGAAEYTWVGASNDWSNVASYTVDGSPATTLPGRDDEILLPAGSNVYADDSTIAFFGTVGAIHMKYDNTRFTLTLTTNAVFACPIGQLTTDDYYGGTGGIGKAFTNHIFVKEGPGKLTFDTHNKAYTSGSYNLNTGFHLKEGEIDLGVHWGRSVNHIFKRLIVEENTTLWLMEDGLLWFKGLWGAGTIAVPSTTPRGACMYINQSPEQRNDPEQKDVPTEFSGKITGKFFLLAPYGSTNFTGTENDFVTSYLQVYGGTLERPNATCGFMSLGPKNTVSSLGKTPSVILEKGNVTLRYLGSGDDVSDRGVEFKTSVEVPLVIDAGASGSLTLTGEFKHNVGNSYPQHRVTFTGSNPYTASVSSNKFKTVTDPTSGKKCSFFVRKSGSGTWRFADRSADNTLSGVVGVDGGTLEFDTIRDIGWQCALGDATDLYEDSGAQVANLQEVSYAHFVGGTDADAVFSYVGSSPAYVEDRPVGVSGKGRFQAPNSAAYWWKGFRGVGAGEKRMTYMCEAGQTNLVSDVADSNGGAEGTLSVVKDGPGDLVLSGNLTFGGDLVAKGGGALRVRDLHGSAYEYYRLVIKETTAGSPLPEYSQWTTNTSRDVALSEFGLYNASGSRVNQFGAANTNSSVVTMLRGQSAMLYDSKFSYSASGADHFGRLFDATASSGQMFWGQWTAAGKCLNPNDPSTWVKVVVRMPTANIGKVASFDLNYSYGYSRGEARANPTAFSIDASVDGLNWSELYSTNNIVFMAPDYYFWLSSMTSPFTNLEQSAGWRVSPEVVWHGRIPLPSATNDVVYSMLGNVRSISAAAGTKLVFEGENGATKTVAGLRVSAADGIGTFENFALGEGSTLYVDGVGNVNSLTIPGDLSTLDGIENVTELRVNGAPSTRYTFEIRTTGVRLDRRGVRIIIR